MVNFFMTWHFFVENEEIMNIMDISPYCAVHHHDEMATHHLTPHGGTTGQRRPVCEASTGREASSKHR